MESPVASSCKIKLYRECGSFEAPPKWESLHGVAEIALDRARSKTPDPGPEHAFRWVRLCWTR
jgi:hypothetical protein